MGMKIKHFYHQDTGTFSYVVTDADTQQCAIIDAVLDYAPASGRLSTESADQILNYIQDQSLKIQWILDTHIHADHLSALGYLKEKTGAKTGIGKHIVDVLQYWIPIFDAADDTPADGSQFDVLFDENDEFSIGQLKARVLHTPGHTPACATYLIEDAAFVGDLIFMPYLGTARADFPGGSATTLYESIQKIYALNDQTRIFTCHDYPRDNQGVHCETTVGEEKRSNIMLDGNTTREAFVTKREERDSQLPVPKLLLPSIQVNLRAGKPGKKSDNGIEYIKIPINQL